MLTRLALVAPLAVSWCTPHAPQSEDAARLVPADATVVVRLESARALNELVRAFAPLAGDAAASFDVQDLLDQAAGPMEGSAASGDATRGSASVNGARLDPGLPLYFASTLDPAGGTRMAFVLPVGDAELPGILGGMPHRSAHLGAFAGFSTDPNYAAGAAPSPLVARLRPGLVSAHVDLATVISIFRPLMETGLSQVEASLDELPAGATPFDFQPMAEESVELARALLDSAESLDVAFERRGDELALRFDYVERVERPSSPVLGDLSGLLGRVDPESAAQVVFNGKWSAAFALFEDFADAALEVYPEPLRTDMRKVLDMQRELDPLLHPGMISAFDFGAAGFHVSYVLRSPRPAELALKLEAMLRVLDHENGLVGVGTAEPLVAEGVEARVLPLTLRSENLFKAFEQTEHGADGVTPGATELDQAQFDQMMTSIYGRELRLAFAVQDELLLMAIARDDALLGSDLARLRAPAQPSPELTRLLERIEPGAAGFAYRMDFGRTMQRMFEAMQGMLPGPAPVLPAAGLSMDFWGSARGRTWSGGVAMNLSQLIGFAQAVQAVGGD